MKATFTFEYDPQNPEESSGVDTMRNGWKYQSILWDIDQYLRSRLKHEELSEDVDAALQLVRDKIHEGCGEHGVNLDS